LEEESFLELLITTIEKEKRKMEKIIFKSVRKVNIRYTIYRDHFSPAIPTGVGYFYSNPSSYVGNDCFQFDTLGDGEVQHTPEQLISSFDLEDFMVSLAVFVAENHSKELVSVLNSLFPYKINDDKIRFLYGIHPSEKTIYINLSNLKTSTSSKKEFDGRWEKLPAGYSPDFEHIFPYLVESYYGILSRVILTERIRKVTEFNLWVDYEKYFGIRDFNLVRISLQLIESCRTVYKELERIEWARNSI